MAAVSMAAADTAQDKLAEIKALAPPPYDKAKQGDAAYEKQYTQSLQDWSEKRNRLILAFVDAYPANDVTPQLLGVYWASLKGYSYPVQKPTIESALKTIADFIAKNPQFTQLGKYYIAMYRELECGDDATKMMTFIEPFLKAYPNDPRGENLLRIAAEASKDPAQKAVLYQRIVDGYPNDPNLPLYKGTVKRLQSVGKPFEISFTDAISGRTVNANGLKGKVVLIDYWATWCAPCIAKMPELKRIYTAYHPQGLEIVGVSLDQPEAQGGLQALKDYVERNQIAWPQYYQGKGWSGDFSASWGIMSIPTAFLVDKKGILRSIDADAGLEDRIKALLQE